MKKSTITLALCGLLLMLFMYNCKNKDADPITPNQELLDKLKAVKMDDVPLKQGDPVVSTDEKIELSAKSLTLNSDISSLDNNGAVSASLMASASEISSVISASELATISKLSPEVLAALKDGGKLPANIQAIMDKAYANAAIASRLTLVTLPTVSGATVKGGRTAAGDAGARTSGVASTTATQISDACIAQAEAAYQVALAGLNASKASQLSAAATLYATATAGVATAQTTCNNTVDTKYDALRLKSDNQYLALHAVLDARMGALGANYWNIKFQLYIQEGNYNTSLNNLEAAAIASCTSKATVALANANAANASNVAAIEATYAAAVVTALGVRDQLAEDCHNQGKAGNI